MFALILSNVMRFFVPLSLFVWGLFMPHAAGYTYLGIYALFAGYLILIDRLKPNPSTDKYSLEEIEIIKKYHLALKFSFGAKDMSVFLNGFRWSGILWVILFLFNQMWIPAIFTVVAFFITAGISVRLDPFFFLGQAVQSGQMQFASELSLLKQVSDKLNAEVENRRLHKGDEEEHTYSEEVQQLLKKADELDKADRHEEAVELYKRIIKINEHCYDAYHGLVWIYGQMDIKNSSNEHAGEMIALGKKLELIDRNYDNYHVLAGSLADLGRLEEALEYYNKAIAYDKRQLKEDSSHIDWLEDNYKERAKILFKLKRYEEALESYDNAIKKAIERSGDNKSCSDLYAAKREIYCIQDNIPMVAEMDNRFAESAVLWDDYFNSEEYDADCGDRFREIANKLKKSAYQEVPVRRQLSYIVLEMLKSYLPEELAKDKVRIINEKIDYVLEQVDFDKNLRYIEKAYIAMIVNTTLNKGD
jgi:tetratricopeptide (TPR) repeat protein